jgi:hypothetical protein
VSERRRRAAKAGAHPMMTAGTVISMPIGIEVEEGTYPWNSQSQSTTAATFDQVSLGHRQ